MLWRMVLYLEVYGQHEFVHKLLNFFKKHGVDVGRWGWILEELKGGDWVNMIKIHFMEFPKS